MRPMSETTPHSVMMCAEPRLLGRAVLICLIAFLTVVDLFATQAILPALAQSYGTSPARMSVAVNASTIGMTVASLVMAIIGHRIDRCSGIVAGLVALAIPTVLLAGMPSLGLFAILRIVQGLCMAVAYTLALAYLAEIASPRESAAAFAAYVTGNVASNLFGRILSTAVADHLGVAWNFLAFALLNAAGAILVLVTFRGRGARIAAPTMMRTVGAFRTHLADPVMRAAFAIGFCILFAFIGTFSFVNFVLVRPPYALPMMSVGLVYLVFLPSILTTPLAGKTSVRRGASRTACAALIAAMIGLPLLLLGSLVFALLGLVLVGAGTFFAQATVTGFVGRSARADRAAASGLYLASYFLGGLGGSVILGQAFDRFGWTACVVGIGLSLAIAAVLTRRLRERPE